MIHIQGVSQIIPLVYALRLVLMILITSLIIPPADAFSIVPSNPSHLLTIPQEDAWMSVQMTQISMVI